MIEKVRFGTLHTPADGRMAGNGSAVDIEPSHDIYILAEFDKGDDAALTLQPQVNDSGANWTNIATNMKIWAANDTSDSDEMVRGTDATVFSTTVFNGGVDTADDHRVLLKINPDTLAEHPTTGEPVEELRVVVAGGHADDRGSVTAIFTPLRYKP